MNVAWVTGASSGIGEALALAYSKDHYQLVLSARREEELNLRDSLMTAEGQLNFL